MARTLPSASNTLTLVLPKPHSAQRKILNEARRFNVASLGRRAGKTKLAINLLVEAALPGFPVAYFAPTYRMMDEVWQEMAALIVPVLEITNVQSRRFRLIGGGVIDFWSLEQPDAARGRKYKRVIIDEAAMIGDLANAYQAVIRPTLTDLLGDAWFFSTPRGRNFFWQMFQWGQEEGHKDWVSWQMPTSVNPYIDAGELESARGDMPERTYAQEYLATFIEDSGGVFRHVEACIADFDSQPMLYRTYVMGVDWAKSHDWTVLTVMDADTGHVVAWDRFNQVDWAVQRQRLAALAAEWRVTTILAERNSIGDPNIEALQREGLPVYGFTTTNATKAQIVEGLALAIETRAISYPNNMQMISELQAFEMERLPSGLVRYGAAPGMHDDSVISLALAHHACGNMAGPLDGEVAGLLANFRGV